MVRSTAGSSSKLPLIMASKITAVAAVAFAVLALAVYGMVGGRLAATVENYGYGVTQSLAASGWNAWVSSKDPTKARRGSKRRLDILVREGKGRILNAFILNGQLKPHSAHGSPTDLDDGGATGTAARVEGRFRGEPAILFKAALQDEEGKVRGQACVIVSAAAESSSNMLLAFGGIAIFALLAVFGVSMALTSSFGAPLDALVQAVSRINRGNLHYHSTMRGRDPVARLSHAIENMVDALVEGEEASEALGERENEAKEAGQLQEALLPHSLPVVEGFEVAADHVAGSRDGGSFFDAVSLGKGRLALIVAASSGKGAPGSIIASTGRAYLRAYLQTTKDAAKALKLTNRAMAKSMIKGLHLTVQVAVLDPAEGKATVYIAGHRAPFYACRGGEVSVVHGEGLAVGLDKGPVFEKRLEEVEVDMPSGTRIVMTTPGTYEVEGEDGTILGIDAFQELVRKHAPKNSGAFLHMIHGALDVFIGEAERKMDTTLVTAKRMV